jgi:hypothetical protein
MARIRTVKPEFFRHYGLYQAEKETRLPLRVAFAGLWTAADREGRFRWDPPNLKLDCLPYDEIDFSKVLEALRIKEFVVRYQVGDGTYGYIPSWKRHQVINQREAQSVIPEPEAPAGADTCMHVQVSGERKGREGEMEGREAPSAPPPAKGRRRSRSVPPDFAVSDQLKRWATETRPDLDIDWEIEKFRDHEFKDPKTDWGAAFRNWVRNARSEKRNNAGGKSCKPDTVGRPPPSAGPLDPEYETLVMEKADELFGGLES